MDRYAVHSIFGSAGISNGIESSSPIGILAPRRN
jgi:hypothetical protein